MKRFLVLAALCLGACAPDTSAAVDNAHAAVRARMRDPESAEFTDVVVSKRAYSEVVVCGMVNAKNGFGGYAGPTRFVAHVFPDDVSVVTEPHGDNDVMTALWARDCTAS